MGATSIRWNLIRSSGGIVLSIFCLLAAPTNAEETINVHAKVAPAVQSKWPLWKALAGFSAGASERERIGAFREALPAIVEGGRTLLWVLDTSDLCCSELSQQWVMARDLATGRDRRRWKIVDNDQSGVNLLDSSKARNDLRELTRLLTAADSRMMGRWTFGDPKPPEALGGVSVGFDVEVGHGLRVAIPQPGKLEIHRGNRIIHSRPLEGLGRCPSVDGEAMVACSFPLLWVAGWSDTLAKIAVMRFVSNDGCDGCEPTPLDLVIHFPETVARNSSEALR
jgi:hypothetical protein